MDKNIISSKNLQSTLGGMLDAPKIKFSKKFLKKDLKKSLVEIKDGRDEQKKSLEIMTDKDFSNIITDNFFLPPKKDENLPDIKSPNPQKKLNESISQLKYKNYLTATTTNFETTDIFKDEKSMRVSKDLYNKFDRIPFMNSNLLNSVNLSNQSAFKSSNNLSSKNTRFQATLNNNYCPHCSHCNSYFDQNFENNLHSIKTAKNIITNSFEFIIKNETFENKMQFFSSEYTKDNEEILGEVEDILQYTSKFNSHNFKNDRLIDKTVSHFLEALIKEKCSLESIVGNNILLKKFEKIIEEKSILAQRQEENNFFDDELEEYFDEKTRELIKKFIRSK